MGNKLDKPHRTEVEEARRLTDGKGRVAAWREQGRIRGAAGVAAAVGEYVEQKSRLQQRLADLALATLERMRAEQELENAQTYFQQDRDVLDKEVIRVNDEVEDMRIMKMRKDNARLRERMQLERERAELEKGNGLFFAASSPSPNQPNGPEPKAGTG